MSASESNSSVVAEDEDEEEAQIYQFIYEMDTMKKEDLKEEVQIPPSSGPTPVHLKKNAENDGSEDRTTPNTTPAQRQKDELVDNAKEPDLDALKNIQEMAVKKSNAEEKPWRKAGADISDYFNYGFDEESWNTYCKKQLTAHRKSYNKIKVKKGHTGREEKESYSASPSSGNPTIPASRRSSATVDVIGGPPGSSGGVEKHRFLSVEGNNTQVDTKMSPKEERITSYHLPAPSNSLFEFTPPPPFLWRRGPPPLSSLATLDRRQYKDFDGPSSSLYTCSSGVSSSIPRSMSSRAGLINATTAWECHMLQEKHDERRDRSEHGRAKVSKRGSGGGRESCPSSYNSGEERLRHRDTTERGHKHHSFKRSSLEKEQQRERRHRDKSDGRQKSSCSSSSGSRSSRDSGEDRDSQSRPNHKKARRNREDRESNC